MQQPSPHHTESPSLSKDKGFIAFFRRNQQRLGLIFTLFVFILALFVCSSLVQEIDKKQLLEAFRGVSYHSIGFALLAAIISYLMIFGYEWSASHYAGVYEEVPLQTLLLGGLTAASIGNALGFSMLTGGSVRYRVYSRKGLSAISIIQMTVFASLSLGTALPPIAALMAFTDIQYSAKALHISNSLLIIIASLILIGYTVALVVVSFFITPEHPSKDSRLLNIGLTSLRVPSLRIVILQFIITFLDMIAAGTVLYALLPESISSVVPFGTFLTIYLLALATGVLSHIPGGLGVFEAILLAAFGDSVNMAGLFAALLLYRFIYVILPLLVSCLVLLVVEARRFANTRQAVKIASSIAPPIIALLVFVSGVVLLCSSIMPQTMGLENAFVVSSIFANISHLIASLIGGLCLIVAQALWRRLKIAWTLSICFLVIGSSLAILNALDWRLACSLAFLVCIMITFRETFYRPGRLFDIPCSPLNLVIIGCTIIFMLWLFLFVYRHVPHKVAFLWQIASDGDIPRAIRSIIAASLLLIITSIFWFVRGYSLKTTVPTDDELALALQIIEQSGQPQGNLVLGKDKSILFHPQQDAFIMYARHGRSLVALFDPIGNIDHRNELIWLFRDFCDKHHLRPIFYQVCPDSLSDYMDIGLANLKVGDEAILYLDKCNVMEMVDSSLPDILEQGIKHGLVLEVYEPSKAPFDQLNKVSQAWTSSKIGRSQVKGFSSGRFTEDYVENFRVAAIKQNDEILAFVCLLETQQNKWVSLDLGRAHPDAPKYVMEYLMITLIDYLQKQNVERLALGMVTQVQSGQGKKIPLAQRLGNLALRRGELFYGYQTARTLREKFQPTWEPRYMAVPAGLDPLIAWTDTAALVAGNLTALVKR